MNIAKQLSKIINDLLNLPNAGITFLAKNSPCTLWEVKISIETDEFPQRKSEFTTEVELDLVKLNEQFHLLAKKAKKNYQSIKEKDGMIVFELREFKQILNYLEEFSGKQTDYRQIGKKLFDYRGSMMGKQYGIK